jgi:hypothetical protein
MKPKPFWALNHFTVPIAIVGSFRMAAALNATVALNAETGRANVARLPTSRC